MKKKEYSKLTKRCRRLFSLSQLWLGKDHIILIEESSASQTYRRFYFKDIEGIVLGDTSLHIVYFILSFVLVAIMARIFSGLELFAETTSRIWAFVMLGFFLLIGVYQFIAGKINNLAIQTKNGPFKLPIRLRQRKMKKMLNKIIPLINQFQELESIPPITTDEIEIQEIKENNIKENIEENSIESSLPEKEQNEF